MKVLEALRAKDGGDKLADRLETEVRERAHSKLEHFRDLFPDFTDHSIQHGDGVVAILDWLLADDLKERLNEWELYFLVAAAYLHDIGMVEGCPGSPSGAEWEAFYSTHKERECEKEVTDESAILRSAKRDFVRDHHHERSAEYIEQEWRELGLRATDTAAEGEIVARLALGHRKVDLGDRTMFAEIPFGSNQLIRRDLVAAYLRLADELDMTAHRTPWAEYEVLTDLDPTAELEWKKHLSVSGVFGDQGVIAIAAKCHSHEVFLRLDRLNRELKLKLAEMKRMLRRPYATGDGLFLDDPLPYHDLDFKIEHVGYLPINIKFELQDEEIMELIMGERLYGEETACIRELLQNAVDTCREAREQNPARWEAQIDVREEEEGKFLTVSDNGMGMDEYIVREYFSRVGVSYYSSPDFEGNFRPISEFGIGILSCFMLAERIEVDTLRKGSDPLHLELRSLTEPFVPTPGSRTEPGTTVKLHLKPEKVGTVDILERVRHFARHVEFPIGVIRAEGTPTLVTDPGLLRPEEAWYYKGGGGDAEGLHLGVSLFGPRHEIGQTRAPVSQQGFFVEGFREVFDRFARNAWCELNLAGERQFVLTADRTRTGAGSDQVWQDVEKLYSSIVEDIYDDSEELQSPQDWWKFHLRYYADRMASIPTALSDAAARHAKFCTFSAQGFHAKPLSEVKDWDGPKHAITRGDHETLEHIRELVPQDWCIVVLPVHHEPRAWSGSLVGAEVFREERALRGTLDFQHFEAEIAGGPCHFINAGARLGPWWINWDWLLSGGIYYPYFDSRHPFSELLIKYCTGDLPTRGGDRLRDMLSASALSYSPDELLRREKEVLQILAEDGVIPPDAVYEPELEQPPPSHDCPYGTRVWD